MKINIVDKNIRFQIEDLTFVLSPNGGGKTRLCETLVNGFEGKLNKKFLVDGNSVDKTEYSVYYIKDLDTMDLEKAFTSKSILKNRIKQEMDSLEENEKERLQLKIIELEQEIGDIIFGKVNDVNVQLKLGLDAIDLIGKFTTIDIDEKTLETMSFSQKRMAYIDFIISVALLDPRPCVLIIDEISLGLSKLNCERVKLKLKNLTEKKVVKVIATSSVDVGEGFLYVYAKKDDVSNALFSDEDVCLEIAKNEGVSIEEVRQYCMPEEIEKYAKKYDMYNQKLHEFLNK